MTKKTPATRQKPPTYPKAKAKKAKADKPAKPTVEQLSDMDRQRLNHKAFKSVFDGIAREHSRKPDEFYAMVEQHCRPIAPLDLFSRQERPGWVSWGNETGKFAAMERLLCTT